MRTAAAAIVACAALATAPAASAERLPPGSIGVMGGAVSGTGADARRLGYGYLWGAHAAWQPMETERRLGYSIKWSFLFGTLDEGTAASVRNSIETLEMDLLVGLRLRPGTNPSRYIALRAGGQLLRADQVIPPKDQRAFVGLVANIGLEQYAYASVFSADIRVSQIGYGPTTLSFVVGWGKTGP